MEERHQEDLIRLATALVERIEFAIPGFDRNIVAGFRRDGALSLFFGEETVYQFTSDGKLRRAYAGERLLKAERGRLVGLTRHRTAHESQLVRHELDEQEQAIFLTKMLEHLRLVETALATRQLQIIGQAPPQAPIIDRLQDWLMRYGRSASIANSPQVR